MTLTRKDRTKLQKEQRVKLIRTGVIASAVIVALSVVASAAILKQQADKRALALIKPAVVAETKPNGTPAASFAAMHANKEGAGKFTYMDMNKGEFYVARDGAIWGDKPLPPHGRWYFEVHYLGGNAYYRAGLSDIEDLSSLNPDAMSARYLDFSVLAKALGVAVDMDKKTVKFYIMKVDGTIEQVNSSWTGVKLSWKTDEPLYPFVGIMGLGSSGATLDLAYSSSQGFYIKNRVPELAAYHDLAIAY